VRHEVFDIFNRSTLPNFRVASGSINLEAFSLFLAVKVLDTKLKFAINAIIKAKKLSFSHFLLLAKVWNVVSA
jgi:hypothetical protein